MYWALENQERNHKQRSAMDSYAWTYQFWPTWKDFHQQYTDTVCNLEFLPKSMDDKTDVVRESEDYIPSMRLSIKKFLKNLFSLIIISENIKISMLQKDKATNEFIK